MSRDRGRALTRALTVADVDVALYIIRRETSYNPHHDTQQSHTYVSHHYLTTLYPYTVCPIYIYRYPCTYISKITSSIRPTFLSQSSRAIGICRRVANRRCAPRPSRSAPRSRLAASTPSKGARATPARPRRPIDRERERARRSRRDGRISTRRATDRREKRATTRASRERRRIQTRLARRRRRATDRRARGARAARDARRGTEDKTRRERDDERTRD